MSAIVAAAVELARVAAGKRAKASLGLLIDGMLAELYEQRLAAAGRAIVAASNAAGAGRVVAMRLADCGCVEVTHGDGTTRIDPFMPWKCDPRPCAWPRPFARGADR